MGTATQTQSKTSKKEAMEKQRILTPEFRASYPHLFKPSQVMGKGDFKYSITMLFPKDGDLTVLKNAIKQAKISRFGSKENWPDNIESPVNDGDLPKFADKEGYKDHWAIKAISNMDSKPGLVDQDVQPIVNQSDFYPGCYARAYVFARVWEFSGKYGVHFILDHVQKTKDGPSFSGKKPADQVFSPIDRADDGGTGDIDDDDEEDFK